MTIGAPHTLLATILTGSTFLATTSYTQVMDTGSIFSQPVSMDSFVVKSGFDINAFIRRVKNDTTFYKAFRSMHLVPFTAQNNIEVYHKQKNSLIASEYCITQQDIKNNCRSTKITEQVTTGNYSKRNGEYNYYTASLFHYLFIPQSIICNEDDIVAALITAAQTANINNRNVNLTGILEEAKNTPAAEKLKIVPGKILKAFLINGGEHLTNEFIEFIRVLLIG